jgi:hypothetical protein
MRNFILNYKTLILELLLRLRALISISLFLGIDLGLSLNEEEGVEEVEKTEIESNPDLINNEELPLSQTESELIEPESEPITETNKKNEEDKDNQNRNIMKEKERVSEIMDVTTASISAAIVSLGTIAVQQSPTASTKATASAITLAAVGISAAGLTATKHKMLDTFDEYTDINNRPPSPGHGEFNLVDINSFYDYWLSLINKINNLDIDSQIIIYSVLLLLICLFYILYIFSFIIAPSIFDVIKDHLPIKFNNLIIKFININRKISVPFIILSFISLILCLLVAIFLLTTMVYLNNLNP